MKTFLAITGAAFWIASGIGMMVPGMNFHIVFADDPGAMKFHQRLAAELQTRIEYKDADINPD